MKRPVLLMLAVLALLVVPGLAVDSWAAPPPCDTRCSCAVSCSTLCSNPGVITCGYYGDCIDKCGFRAAAAASPVVTAPPVLATEAPESCAPAQSSPAASPSQALPAFLAE